MITISLFQLTALVIMLLVAVAEAYWVGVFTERDRRSRQRVTIRRVK